MNKRIVVLLLVQSSLLLFLLWLAVNFAPTQLIRFFEELFSSHPSDGVLSIPNRLFVKYALSILFLAVAEYYLIECWATLKEMLGRDHLLKMNRLLRAILVISVLVSILWVPIRHFYPSLLSEDGLFESATAILLLLSSFTLFVKFFLTQGKRNLWWLAPAFIFLLIGLEEISWGQRIFRWVPGDFFQTHNIQEETNLHNLAFLTFPLRTPIFTFIGGLVLLESRSLILLLTRSRKNVGIASIFPGQNFVPFGIGFLVMAFMAIYIKFPELFEFNTSLVIFGYASTRK